MRWDISDARVAEQTLPAWLWPGTTGQLKGPHPLFTFPLCIHGSPRSTCSNHDHHLLLPVKQASLASAEQQRRPIAHPLSAPVPPSPFPVAVAKLSASFGQKWYPARRHAPSERGLLLSGFQPGKCFCKGCCSPKSSCSPAF